MNQTYNINKKFQKLFTIFLFFLLGFSSAWRASHLVNQPSTRVENLSLSRAKCEHLIAGYCKRYNISKKLFQMIILYFFDDARLRRYKNKKLTGDLSKRDLSNHDFTGCQFMGVDLTDSVLNNVILKDTTCNYVNAFYKNSIGKRLYGREWYLDNLSKEIESIQKVYPQLKNDEDKATMLLIACGLSRFPLYEGHEFYLKAQYWSCSLLSLKKKLKCDGRQLVCLLGDWMESDAAWCCWESHYPSDKLTVDSKKAPHADFGKYIKEFNKGLYDHCLHFSSRPSDCNPYVYGTAKKIRKLEKAYSHFTNHKEVQQAICDTAYAFSKGYQLGNFYFIFHYISCENEIIRLKNMTKKTGIHIDWESIMKF